MDPASTLPTIELQAPMTQATKKKRIRNWTAEDRALHREFEKSRREAFSESLMVGVLEPFASVAQPINNS